MSAQVSKAPQASTESVIDLTQDEDGTTGTLGFPLRLQPVKHSQAKVMLLDHGVHWHQHPMTFSSIMPYKRLNTVLLQALLAMITSPSVSYGCLMHIRLWCPQLSVLSALLFLAAYQLCKL